MQKNTPMKIKRINTEDTQLRLTNKLITVCNWIDAWTIAVVGGRGLAKSQEIQAERTIRVIEDMPGAPTAFITDTYVNFKTNILPAVKIGWRRKGYVEGIHYVQDKRPPQDWLDRCKVIVDEFDHTIFFYNGSVIFSGSLDRPSLLAGKSVVHIFSDEAKYQADKKVNAAFPILRGDKEYFGASVYFLGFTVTTDMPSVTEGEYDWIFRYAKKMNVERMKLILLTFDQLNKARIKLYNEYQTRRDVKEMERLESKIGEWEYRYRKVRHDQTFFITASSLVNIQHLSVKYITGMITTLETHDFNKSVLSIRPKLKKSLRFYPNLSENHFYFDGINYSYYDRFSYSDKIQENSLGLRYCDKLRKLEAGVDVGNMKSFVVAQDDGKFYRLLKFLYTIPPESYRELADQFIAYFRFHENKELDMYYDRAANNFRELKEDAATKIKEAIEKDASGVRTGWRVNLKSIGQPNIPMDTEYEFMVSMLKEDIPGLPKLRIDAVNCKEVKSSLENTRAIIKYRKNIKIVAKDKRSERLPVERLPMESSNPSDAVKYLICRKDWIKLTKPKSNKSAFVQVGMV